MVTPAALALVAPGAILPNCKIVGATLDSLRLAPNKTMDHALAVRW